MNGFCELVPCSPRNRSTSPEQARPKGVGGELMLDRSFGPSVVTSASKPRNSAEIGLDVN